MIRVGILTISDKGSQGKRADISGNKVIRDMVTGAGMQIVKYDIVPDEVPLISSRLSNWADSGEMDVILSTGGTGLGPRDVTPEATRAILDKEVPGFAEIVRVRTFSITPLSILSRATAGIRKKCLIINMPGNPKAVKEYLEIITPAISHGVEIITGAYTEHPVPNE